VVNLGDFLVPSLINALGYSCALSQTNDSVVINPGRCLTVVGSLLTRHEIARIGYPLDVWGCGWRGKELSPTGQEDVRFFAVRGPQTAAGLHLSSQIALGDPALLLPHLVPLDVAPHGRTVVIPHFSRLSAMSESQRRLKTGCDEVLSPMVLRSPRDKTLWRCSLKTAVGLLHRRIRYGIQIHSLWSALRRIAGADFVLTGSLHGAILSQTFGVPWAAYHDGYVDTPPKWTDWAAYLGIDIELVQTLRDGRNWWRQSGYRGRVRDLEPLLKSFPYEIRNPTVWSLVRKGAFGNAGDKKNRLQLGSILGSWESRQTGRSYHLSSTNRMDVEAASLSRFKPLPFARRSRRRICAPAVFVSTSRA
jgi:hypothetical protein